MRATGSKDRRQPVWQKHDEYFYLQPRSRPEFQTHRAKCQPHMLRGCLVGTLTCICQKSTELSPPNLLLHTSGDDNAGVQRLTRKPLGSPFPLCHSPYINKSSRLYLQTETESAYFSPSLLLLFRSVLKHSKISDGFPALGEK